MKNIYYLIFSVMISFTDQITKIYAVKYLIPYHPKKLMFFANFTLAFNNGAAFSFLDGLGPWHDWLLIFVSISMSIILFLWLNYLDKSQKMLKIALSVILGGAVGNLIDRVIYHQVVDFIDMHYQNWHWPIFNIADIAICIGVLLMSIDSLKKTPS